MKTNFKFNIKNTLKAGQKLLIPLLCTNLLWGCGKASAPVPSGAPAKPLQIVAEIFPAYDWTREILGDNPAGADLTLLLDNGVDLHSYNPTVADITKLSSCDILIYVGGESDAWIEDALQEAVNPNMIALNLLEILGDKAVSEELREGMQSREEAEEGEEVENDEHVWLSLRNAALFTEAICDALCTADPVNKDHYLSRGEDYKNRLAQLDREYERVIGDASENTLLFADRFPFRYLTEDYGLSYYAAFPGCSAESEANFSTITFLAEKTDELSLPALLIIDRTDPRIASVIRDCTKNKNQQILVLNSMQSLGTAEARRGITYLSVTEENLDVLKTALN